MGDMTIGVIVHGEAGCIGVGQRVSRALPAVRRDGGVTPADGSRLTPKPMFAGRNADQLACAARGRGDAPGNLA